MDIMDTELYTSIEQLPGDWDPLVSGPEALIVDAMADDTIEDDPEVTEQGWSELAIAYEYWLQDQALEEPQEDEDDEAARYLAMFNK